MRRIGVVIATVLGVLALAVSLAGLTRAQDGGTVRATTVDGIPTYLYSTGQSAPTVVVAHGFSGSARIMDPLARGLMRAGFTVVTFDFPGHGANTAPLTATSALRDSNGDVLQATLSDVLRGPSRSRRRTRTDWPCWGTRWARAPSSSTSSPTIPLQSAVR